MSVRVLRSREVQRLTGLSRASIDRAEKAGRFPQRVKLSDFAIGWVEAEITAWIEARIAERDRAPAEGDSPN